MAQHLFPNFLHDPAEYAQAERYWQDLFTRVTREAGVEGEWQSPWLVTRFADGTPFADGNPIFSAWSPVRRVGVRVIQYEGAAAELDGAEFESWLDTFDPEGENVRELVISCALSADAEREAIRLLRPWVANGACSVAV